jgi:putative FmdB family regulatory protein
MPIYEYQCEECSTEFERLVKNGDDVVNCECGSEKVSRRWSVFAAHTASTSSGGAAPMPSCQTCPAGGSCGLS